MTTAGQVAKWNEIKAGWHKHANNVNMKSKSGLPYVESNAGQLDRITTCTPTNPYTDQLVHRPNRKIIHECAGIYELACVHKMTCFLLNLPRCAKLCCLMKYKNRVNVTFEINKTKHHGYWQIQYPWHILVKYRTRVCW